MQHQVIRREARKTCGRSPVLYFHRLNTRLAMRAFSPMDTHNLQQLQ
jgi:hypothetical protein